MPTTASPSRAVTGEPTVDDSGHGGVETIEAELTGVVQADGAVELTVEPEDPDANYAYQWSSEGVEIAGAVEASHTAPASGAVDDFAVVVTDLGPRPSCRS